MNSDDDSKSMFDECFELYAGDSYENISKKKVSLEYLLNGDLYGIYKKIDFFVVSFAVSVPLYVISFLLLFIIEISDANYCDGCGYTGINVTVFWLVLFILKRVVFSFLFNIFLRKDRERKVQGLIDYYHDYNIVKEKCIEYGKNRLLITIIIGIVIIPIVLIWYLFFLSGFRNYLGMVI